MKKYALLFAGQGSQYTNMGKDLYETYPCVKEIFDQASEYFGFDVYKTATTASESEIAQTVVSQPLIYTMSVAVYTLIKEKLGTVAAFAGHSLGEYAALTCAGVLTFEQGCKIIKARSIAMQKCAEAKGGSMYAIIGSDEETITNICNQTEGYVLPVNFNSNAQTVIAGDDTATKLAAEKLSELGAKAIKLGVNSAFHSEFMSDAAKELKEFVTNMGFNNIDNLDVHFYSNLTGEKLSSIENLADYFATHLVSPVKFTTELNNMKQDGIDTFIEVGPNKILSGLVKKTLKDVTILNVDSLKTYEKFLSNIEE